ncbi:diguanylate cyclase [Defluviimonas sp. WL0024]|uniref:diguanylate cyclase n=1 Tax=Albidovulum salinarum TaxID=2984153 RepID=A0ABT2X1E8_9RHOB|nr:diguanylate cyclase [Defluviimonas sp. WL0024]MCU9847772.1 diguanylate cyclase [Defluviimonas sp. WL0024]
MAGKILIVDDVATNRIVLKVKLASAFYETVQAACGVEALKQARGMRPDLVLLDVELPDMNGIEVCRRLKADPATSGIPVVMVTAFHDHARKMEALAAGAEEVFWKPLDEAVLMARLRSLLRARETAEQLGLRDGTYRELGFAEGPQPFAGPALVGLIAGRAETALAWKRDLAGHLNDRLQALDGTAVLGDLGSGPVPDVFVVAADLARPGDGLTLMSELRSRPATRFSAVCVMLPRAGRDTAAMALDLGASDLIEPGADPVEMALRIRTQIARKRQSDRLRASLENGLRLAMTDPLTGLNNRRYALPHLARIAERARAAGRQFAVMVLDLDRFKAINDSRGHAAGDAVLIEVAARLRGNLRAVDLLARIGGEEFLVALPDTTPEAAQATAERLRRVIGDRPVPMPDGAAAIPVTLSIGLALGPGPASVEDLVDLADRALMGSKADGRNIVTVGRSAA